VSARSTGGINIDLINVDRSTARREDRRVTTYVGASEAARILGVERSTLYAYVSRGIVSRRSAVDGRTSLYALEELEALADRTRRGAPPAERPTIDVRIVSAITVLDEDGPSYRGHDVATLARTVEFELVAELLWTGELPHGPIGWPPPDGELVGRARAAVAALGPGASWLGRIGAVVTTAAVGHATDSAPVAARRILAAIPSVLGGDPEPGVGDATFAGRVTSVLTGAPDADPRLVDAVRCALVLLADHELATSTLAVRIAGSVRTDPYAAICAGLAVVSGALHGAAGVAAGELLAACADQPAAELVRRRLARGERLPGFGHMIYRTQDPRFTVLIDAVRALPDPDGRLPVVEDLLRAAGQLVGRPPNIDLALAALTFVAGADPDFPLFAIGRIAGWAAHFAEELGERPVRFRGLARRPA
jgi:citrate synthase